VPRARDSAEVLYAGELEIRLGEGLVLANGQPLTLSVREFDLLAAMARRVGAVVTREELYGTVWGPPLRRGDRSVDVYVIKFAFMPGLAETIHPMWLQQPVRALRQALQLSR